MAKYYIYEIKNNINGKTYVGQHKVNDRKDTYMGSGTLLHKAYEKYGIDNFKKTILCYADTKEEIDKLEIQYIKDYRTKGKAEYNIAQGGQGGSPMLGKHLTQEWKNNIAASVTMTSRYIRLYDWGYIKYLFWNMMVHIEIRKLKEQPISIFIEDDKFDEYMKQFPNPKKTYKEKAKLTNIESSIMRDICERRIYNWGFIETITRLDKCRITICNANGEYTDKLVNNSEKDLILSSYPKPKIIESIKNTKPMFYGWEEMVV